jgi:hypothetical protein
MPRPANIIRPVKLTTTFPEDVMTRLELHLFSDVEGRVPHGAYQQFLCDRIREFFDSRAYDTGHGVVRGTAEAIEFVKLSLEKA